MMRLKSDFRGSPLHCAVYLARFRLIHRNHIWELLQLHISPLVQIGPPPSNEAMTSSLVVSSSSADLAVGRREG